MGDVVDWFFKVADKFGKRVHQNRKRCRVGGIGGGIDWHLAEVVHKGEVRLAGSAVRYPLLLVCKESRDEVMKQKGNFSTSIPGAPKIYANFSIDTI